jgi:uncharacterized membrane protein YoaK (UPF0700 family)
MTVIAVLLTFASGASDVASFTRLGNVFTSVMTGNMVIFGLSLARGSVSLASHTAVAVAGYVAGVAGGTRVMWYHAARDGGSGDHAGEWPLRITLTLLIELILFAAVAAGWELTGSRPTGATQFVVLVLAACAMGIQSAAVNQMGLSNVSTTYLTGTLTGLVSAIARPGGKPTGRRRPGVLLGLVAGAVLAGTFLATVPAVVPLLPLLAVAVAVTLGSGRARPRGTTLSKFPIFRVFSILSPKAREPGSSCSEPGSSCRPLCDARPWFALDVKICGQSSGAGLPLSDHSSRFRGSPSSPACASRDPSGR